MAQWAQSNFMCNSRCTDAQTKLNAGSRLRLFKSSSITPSPADTLSTYTAAGVECDFDTYAIKTLTSGWGSPVKIIDGQYRTSNGAQSYSSPATTGNTIYGAFMDDGSGNLIAAIKFDASINFAVAAPALSLTPVWDVYSKSIL